MVVKERCKCGGTFRIDDPKGKYLSSGGESDMQGRVYIWQRTPGVL